MCKSFRRAKKGCNLKAIILFFLLFRISFGEAKETSEYDMMKSNLSSFMPGFFGVAPGISTGSDGLGTGKSLDFHTMYFPFKRLGFGAFYEYVLFQNINLSTYNAELTQAGLEVLGLVIKTPFSIYLGPIAGRGKLNLLNQRIKLDGNKEYFYGGLLGTSYQFNDAFSLGPKLRYIKTNNTNRINSLSVQLEIQYRFVLY